MPSSMHSFGLPSHEEVLTFVSSSEQFLEKLLQLGRISREEGIEVALKVESGIRDNQFYISELGKGDDSTASSGASTCPYSWSEKLTVFSLHSHLTKEGKPKAAIFSISDFFTYVGLRDSNVYCLSQATGLSRDNMFESFGGNLLHQEGIVRAEEDTIGLLIYQAPIDVIKPERDGYDLAKINNHYVDLIQRIGRENLDNQQRIVDELRRSGYTAAYLRFETRGGTIVDRL